MLLTVKLFSFNRKKDVDETKFIKADLINLKDIETPFDLPRQVDNPICPKNIILTQHECINAYTPNMGNMLGFDGYILNMLIDHEKLEIWDARGERAT